MVWRSTLRKRRSTSLTAHGGARTSIWTLRQASTTLKRFTRGVRRTEYPSSNRWRRRSGERRTSMLKIPMGTSFLSGAAQLKSLAGPLISARSANRLQRTGRTRDISGRSTPLTTPGTAQLQSGVKPRDLRSTGDGRAILERLTGALETDRPQILER